jgi:hypothetical protein
MEEEEEDEDEAVASKEEEDSEEDEDEEGDDDDNDDDDEDDEEAVVKRLRARMMGDDVDEVSTESTRLAVPINPTKLPSDEPWYDIMTVKRAITPSSPSVGKRQRQRKREEHRTSIQKTQRPLDELRRLNSEKGPTTPAGADMTLGSALASGTMDADTALGAVRGMKSKTRRKNRKTFKYELAAIIGPFQTEYEAELIRRLWNHRSRAIMPRAAFCDALASYFHVSAGINPDVVSGTDRKYWDVQIYDQTVFLTRKKEYQTGDSRKDVACVQLPDTAAVPIDENPHALAELVAVLKRLGLEKNN